MNKPNFTELIERSSDFLENLSRGILFATFKSMEQVGSNGAKKMERQARLKRNQNTIK